jgi:hypothetical protein
VTSTVKSEIGATVPGAGFSTTVPKPPTMSTKPTKVIEPATNLAPPTVTNTGQSKIAAAVLELELIFQRFQRPSMDKWQYSKQIECQPAKEQSEDSGGGSRRIND